MADFVPNRIDRDPVIMKGVTNPEFKMIAVIASAISIGSFILFLFVISAVFSMLASAFVLVISLFAGVYMLAAYKRNKPRNYVTHMKHVYIERYFKVPAPFIHKTTHFKSTRKRRLTRKRHGLSKK